MDKLIKILFLTASLFFSAQLFAGEVSRAQFTSEIQNREPVDTLLTLSTDHNQIIYFTELKDLSGHKVTHQWMYNDSVMFEKTFDVGGNRWRVWTQKTLQPGWTGRWTVNILDEDQTVLNTESFEYQ